MEKYKPKNYIEVKNVTKVNFGNEIRTTYYPHPHYYLNNKTIWQYDKNSEERQNWHIYELESTRYNNVLKWCKYDSLEWSSQEVKDKAFETIYTTVFEGDGVVVPLQGFEIYLMNNGWEMMCFDKMCAQSPAICAIAARIEGNKAFGPMYMRYSRFYTKEDKTLYFGFGLKNEYLNYNFYYTDKKRNYQVPIKSKDYKNAEELKLKSFEDKTIEIMKKSVTLK